MHSDFNGKTFFSWGGISTKTAYKLALKEVYIHFMISITVLFQKDEKIVKVINNKNHRTKKEESMDMKS